MIIVAAVLPLVLLEGDKEDRVLPLHHVGELPQVTLSKVLLDIGVGQGVVEVVELLLLTGHKLTELNGLLLDVVVGQGGPLDHGDVVADSVVQRPDLPGGSDPTQTGGRDLAGQAEGAPAQEEGEAHQQDQNEGKTNEDGCRGEHHHPGVVSQTACNIR